MIEPIKPDEVVDTKKNLLPDAVIETFNELIAKHWDGACSKFTKKEAEQIICSKLDCKAKYLYDNHHMDVEDIYRKEGWKVHFDNPAYSETYAPSYEFSKM